MPGILELKQDLYDMEFMLKIPCLILSEKREAHLNEELLSPLPIPPVSLQVNVNLKLLLNKAIKCITL